MNWIPDPLHPAMVHFPIALAFVALLLELLARHPRGRVLEPSALVLTTLAALTGIAAVLSGEAAQEAVRIPASSETLLERHAVFGELVMWLLIALAIARVLLAATRRFTSWRVWLYLAVAVVITAMVGYQGCLGGELVFQHGIGTSIVQRGDGGE